MSNTIWSLSAQRRRGGADTTEALAPATIQRRFRGAVSRERRAAGGRGAGEALECSGGEWGLQTR